MVRQIILLMSMDKGLRINIFKWPFNCTCSKLFKTSSPTYLVKFTFPVPLNRLHFTPFNTSMEFGYARVSTPTQKLDLQVDALLKEDIEPKNIYSDIVSGVKSERKGLDEMLGKLREGDTLIVWKMDRIARSLSHLVKLMEDFVNGHVYLFRLSHC